MFILAQDLYQNLDFISFYKLKSHSQLEYLPRIFLKSPLIDCNFDETAMHHFIGDQKRSKYPSTQLASS